MHRHVGKGNSSPKFISKYRFGKTLGLGTFGKVKLAIHEPTQLMVAIKILDRQSFSDEAIKKVKREINIMRLFSHRHIVRLYDVIETRSKIYVVMEYMSRGELFDYITEHGRLQEDQARQFFQQIISGVECCHRNKVVHRDLKPENLLLDSKTEVKIADFGLSNTMRDGHFLKTWCGSQNYAAPELFHQRLYAGPEVDIWSCGVILYALLCGTLPFDDESMPGLIAKIKSGIYTLPLHLSRGAQDLIARILVVDPINRITIPEIHRHPWFQHNILRYVALRDLPEKSTAGKIDQEIMREVTNLGYQINHVIQSLDNRLQNEATVAYNLLLDNRSNVKRSYLKNEQAKCLKEDINHPEIYLKALTPVQTKWATGFQYRESPRDMMTHVLGILHSLSIRWKQIGHYNIKCLWSTPSSNSTYGKSNTHSEMVLSSSHEDWVSSMNIVGWKSRNAVKFEIQLYQGNGDCYILDLQRIDGAPFLFLEICATFIALALP